VSGPRRTTRGLVSARAARLLGFACWFALGGATTGGEAVAEPPDWSKVPGHDVVLFQPGKSSFEWVLTQAEHSGAPKVHKGKHCRSCHEGEEEDVASDDADNLGLPPTIDVNVKIARDADALYVRLEWTGLEEAPKTKLDPDHEVMATLLFDDGGVKPFAVASCWNTCHSDLPGMPHAAENTQLTKYLPSTRVKITRSGGDENYKPRAELDALLAKDGYIELWQVTANRGQPGQAHDGYVFESRHQNETPLVNAEASYENGKWVAVLSRKLAVGSPLHKDIVAGKVYTVGIAIHEGWTRQRFHYVSYEHTFAFEAGKVDWVVAH
jgi:hypothetical protein